MKRAHVKQFVKQNKKNEGGGTERRKGRGREVKGEGGKE